MARRKQSDLLDVGELHRRFLVGLGGAVRSAPQHARLQRKPLEISCQGQVPWPLRVYMFNCTHHPSERDPGGYRIQLHVPGQAAGARGNFDHRPGAVVLVVGYVAEFEVFVLWDAHAHSSFPNFKGVQVASATVHGAAINGLADQMRELRTSGYREQVVAARTDRLAVGIRQRHELTRAALLGADGVPLVNLESGSG